MHPLHDFQMDLFFSESGHENVHVLFALFWKIITYFWKQSALPNL